MTSLNTSTEDLIRHDLKEGEELLWSGQPRQGYFLRTQDAFIIPFCLVWVGVAIFCEATLIRWALGYGSNKTDLSVFWFFAIFAVPFIVIGVVSVFQHYIVDMKRREKIHYFVTDQRVIIISGRFGQCTSAVMLARLAELKLIERNGTVGDIQLGALNPFINTIRRRNGLGPDHYGPPTLEYLEDVRAVYRLIQKGIQIATREDALGPDKGIQE